MAQGVNKIMEEALALPADARMSLVERLLTSLNLPIRPEIDRAWAEEAERRVGQLDRGEVNALSGEAVLERLLKKHRR